MRKKVCAITGGSSGIGFAAARLMGQKGYTLVLAARTPAKLDTALEQLHKEGIEASACRCDMADWDSVQKLAVSAPEMGYLTGTDILCDGGCVAGKRVGHNAASR